MIDGREVIRALRKSHGLTLRKYADIAGCSYMTIYNIEHDKHKPSLYVFQQLIEPLGYEIVVRKKK